MDERGAIYPLVMLLCLLLVLFLNSKMEQVFSERQLLSRKEDDLRQVRLVQQAAEKAVMGIEGNDEGTLILFSRDGEVEATIEALSDQERIIHIQAITKSDNKKNVKVYYNLDQRIVTKWVED